MSVEKGNFQIMTNTNTRLAASERVTRRAFLVTTLAGTAAFLVACGGGTADQHGAGHGSSTNADAEYDQTFIDAMVPHHEAAVEMAEVARRKAEHPELKALADAIVADQDREIAQMKRWRKEWYGSDTIPPGMGGHQMSGMDTDMKMLEEAQPFDKAFIDAMIPHHQSAIAMAREAQTKAKRQEIKDLAGQIIAAQQREIDQMRSWRALWYPGQ